MRALEASIEGFPELRLLVRSDAWPAFVKTGSAVSTVRPLRVHVSVQAAITSTRRLTAAMLDRHAVQSHEITARYRVFGRGEGSPLP